MNRKALPHIPENIGKRDPDYGGTITDINTLPLGASFYVTNGAWKGMILQDQDGKRCLRVRDVSDAFIHDLPLDKEYILAISNVNWPQRKVQEGHPDTQPVMAKGPYAENTCPVCGADIFTHEGIDSNGKSGQFWVCPACDSSGEQVETRQFERHINVVDGIGCALPYLDDMTQLFSLQIGDWSGDGHEKSASYRVRSNKPVETVREAHFLILERLDFDIDSLCHGYGEDTISMENMQKLINLGIDVSGIKGEERFVSTDVLAEIWIQLLCLADETLHLMLEPEEQISLLQFYGYDERGRHIGHIGYGLFT